MDFKLYLVRTNLLKQYCMNPKLICTYVYLFSFLSIESVFNICVYTMCPRKISTRTRDVK